MKDDSFPFYPDKYINDTHDMTPNTQIAYDKIICKHMLKAKKTYESHMSLICDSYENKETYETHMRKFLGISKLELNNLTKNLQLTEIESLNLVIENDKNGDIYIPWVYESIIKRMAYKQSRRINRKAPNKKTYETHMRNICDSYENHMRNGVYINNNNINNKNINIPASSTKASINTKNHSCKDSHMRNICDSYENHMLIGLDKDVVVTFSKFIDHIEKTGKKMTDIRLKALQDELVKISKDPQTQNKVLLRSIKRGWSSVFPLDESDDKTAVSGLLESDKEFIKGVLEEIKDKKILKQIKIDRINEMIRMINKFIAGFPDYKLQCNKIWFKTSFVPRYIGIKSKRLSKAFLWLIDNYKPFKNAFPIMSDFNDAMKNTSDEPEIISEKIPDDFISYKQKEVKDLFNDIKESINEKKVKNLPKK